MASTSLRPSPCSPTLLLSPQFGTGSQMGACTHALKAAMPCLGDLVGHAHFPPSSCWNKTGNPRSLLLTKPPVGVWGGDREDQGSV